jgi:ribosomal protein S11
MDVAVYVPGEQTSICYLLRAQSRKQMQAIWEITDIMDVLPTKHNGIFLNEKLDTVIVEDFASIN